ncbi:UNVERIFIED_CONTAM: hypothetical protein Slati_4192600 [Sesamum latifolium]|uniref:Endonuclease/exonuclease/phosphatase domain-containing protein n=1 Tax=Sesamum latifolium TaxID=2727402 RepID=A0AAW2TAK2_9LAMI
MYGIRVNSRGKGGGLALLWNKSSFVNLLSFLDSHIDTVIQLDEGEDSWRFIGFYGEPETSNRSTSWNLLRRLSGLSTLLWVCAGDFNAILVDSEKKGAAITPPWQLRDFRETLNDSGLFDIGFEGFPFTWANNREEPHTIWKRLDRACTNAAWFSK